MPLPKPKNAVFAILADHQIMKPGFQSVEEAEIAAKELLEAGFKEVGVIDMVSRRVVKHLIPRSTE